MRPRLRFPTRLTSECLIPGDSSNRDLFKRGLIPELFHQSQLEPSLLGKTLVVASTAKQRHFRKSVGSGSLVLFCEPGVTHGFTEFGILASPPGPVVSAIPAICCDHAFSFRDFPAVPENAPISTFQTSRASFGLRTLSVSPKTAPRFNTPFGTASRNQPCSNSAWRNCDDRSGSVVAE